MVCPPCVKTQMSAHHQARCSPTSARKKRRLTVTNREGGLHLKRKRKKDRGLKRGSSTDGVDPSEGVVVEVEGVVPEKLGLEGLVHAPERRRRRARARFALRRLGHRCVCGGRRACADLDLSGFYFFRGDSGCCAGFREDPGVTRVLRHGTSRRASCFALRLRWSVLFFCSAFSRRPATSVFYKIVQITILVIYKRS